MSSELKIWRSRIVPTARGAIFRAKRWFYATFYSKKLQVSDEIKEKSKENWARLARKLVEETNNRNASDKAARLTIYYYDENGLFKPVKAEIEVYELKQVDKIEVSEF
ncbi:MAG: hypothetical protein DRJ46_01815 [Thermoprotei archaeon]|nr:hypothetical protein [Thermoproteales archaeon]RLE91815.1 MAG: hypothetical protein DRJ46_01815 [Thermoprotei archaeon]